MERPEEEMPGVEVGSELFFSRPENFHKFLQPVQQEQIMLFGEGPHRVEKKEGCYVYFQIRKFLLLPFHWTWLERRDS